MIVGKKLMMRGAQKTRKTQSCSITASREKFRDLVVKTATRSAKKSFESVVLEVYGTPLSGKNGETDSFEWRFLEWLAKGAK